MEKLTENPVLKLIAGFFVWVCTMMFGEFTPAYLAIIVFILVDWISAIWFAWVDPDSSITSVRMRAGVVKLLIYALALSTGHFCSYISALSAFEAYIQGIIGATELTSVFENAKKLADHYKRNYKFLDLIINFLRGHQQGMERSVWHDQKRVYSTDDDSRSTGTESRSGF